MSTVDLSGIVICETSKAVLIDFGTDEDVWVPKSQIDDGYGNGCESITFTPQQEITIHISEWWAEKEGLI